MTIPRFSSIPLQGEGLSADAGTQFDSHFHAVGHSAGWQTPEHILVPPMFGDGDLDGLDFLQTRPGIAPFLRGPYATMYVQCRCQCLHRRRHSHLACRRFCRSFL